MSTTFKMSFTFIVIIIIAGILIAIPHYINLDKEVRSCINEREAELELMNETYINSNDLVFRQRYFPEIVSKKYDLGIIKESNNEKQREMCELEIKG